jgi:hypothetical protein
VQTEPAGELPYPLNGIKIRAVRRQKIQPEKIILRMAGDRVMIASIVGDGYHVPAAVGAEALKISVEGMKGHGIKSFCLPLEDKLPIPQAHGAKIPDTAPRRMMPQNRIGLLWRHPHPTARAILLEMDFVQKPQVHLRISCPSAEFFYIAAAVRGPHEQ